MRHYVREFYRRIRHINRFSSDNLRISGVADSLKDPQHGIGGLFRYMLKEGFIEETGRTRSMWPSNKGREIRVWKWTEKAHALFGGT